MQPVPHHSTHPSTHHGSTNQESTPPLSFDEMSASASLQAQLAQAKLLLAETRHHCQALLEAAQAEAETILVTSRDIAQRMVAEARSQMSHVDMRDRESSQFSALWADLEEDHDADGFFDSFAERAAEDIFSR